jgi:hypothetical protein
MRADPEAITGVHHAHTTAPQMSAGQVPCPCRLNKVGHLYFGKWERRFYTAWAYLLVLSVVTFGPTCGVVAAGLEFGAYEDYVASYGERLRTAASYVSFWCANFKR